MQRVGQVYYLCDSIDVSSSAQKHKTTIGAVSLLHSLCDESGKFLLAMKKTTDVVCNTVCGEVPQHRMLGFTCTVVPAKQSS